VHEQYQAFFPPDIAYVADHAKRAVSSFPLARNFYYGVDYRPGVDITWYKNIPVPTSYMILDSEYDFFGGYDHGRRAGLVHVADRHISPGKKLWTWGNAEFGYMWDRELTDSDGPYVELMAGVFTDNQPDFSWLQPGETRMFSQYWYPIQEIGPAKNANRLAAVNLEMEERKLKVGVLTTEAFEQLRVTVTAGERMVLNEVRDIRPGQPCVETIELSADCDAPSVLLRVLSSDGKEIIRYRPEEKRQALLPEPATEPPPPAGISTIEELYLTGLHLEQYRHATRFPEVYWEEGLRRDADDVRCNNAMGMLCLRRGKFQDAEQYFRRAIARLMRLNPNPYDGEPFYNLGLALKYQERTEEAYVAFYKSVWNQGWQSAGYYALATIDCRRGDFEQALEHLTGSLSGNASHLKARNLKSVILRQMGRNKEALDLVRDTIAFDPLDMWSRNELVAFSTAPHSSDSDEALFRSLLLETHICLDIAFDYADAGLWREAIDLLQRHLAVFSKQQEPYPMVLYSLGYFYDKSGERDKAREYCKQAAQASADYCFPARIEEMLVLQSAIRTNPSDSKAPYYLGNLLYDKRQREEAIRLWECSTETDPQFSIPWRNLGIAWFNVRNNPGRALECYEKAFQAEPSDARLLYELDQLQKRMGTSPAERLSKLERHRDLVDRRDDLVVEFITLCNQTRRSRQALEILGSRRFHPWEGGEGLVSGQYVAAHLLTGRELLEAGEPQEALAHFEAARVYPKNLGEGKHLLTLETQLDYFAGLALDSLGQAEEGQRWWKKAIEAQTGFKDMAYYRALALRSLDRESEAVSVLEELRDFASRQLDAEVRIDYFATSLPNFLLFDDDLQKRNRTECFFLRGLAKLGLRRIEESAADFRQALTLDANHMWAQAELERIEADQAARLKP
jgi:tetratricopeptide (TPR) repeat protein